MNLGIRWDLQRGNREKWGRIAWFDPDVASPIAQAAGLPNLRGALRWVNGDNGRNQQDTPLTDFAPRIGLAYRITEKFVRAQRLWPVLCSAKYSRQRPRSDHRIPRYADGDQPRQQHHAAQSALESVPARRAAAAERPRSGREHRRGDSSAVLRKQIRLHAALELCLAVGGAGQRRHAGDVLGKQGNKPPRSHSEYQSTA